MRLRTDLQRYLSRCSYCGVCLSVCPVYRHKQLEEYGPRGLVALTRGILTRSIQPKACAKPFASCLLCGRCSKVCPASIPMEEIFFSMRRFLHKFLSISLQQRLMARLLAANAKKLDFFQPPVAQILRFTSLKALPAMQPFQMERYDRPGPPRVLYFPGCLIRRFLPEIANLSVQILEKLGLKVSMLAEIGCCGRPLAVQGRNIAKLARNNLDWLSKADCDWLVSSCPGCVDMFQHVLPVLLEGKEQEMAQRLSGKWMDIHTLVLSIQKSMQSKQEAARIWWHKPCLMGAGEDAAARSLLHMAGCEVAGWGKNCCGVSLNLVNMPEAFLNENFDNPWLAPISGKPLKKALPGEIWQMANMANAEAVVTSCPGCFLQLAGETNQFNALPVIYGLEIWAGLVSGTPFPWRSGDSAAMRRA